MGKKAVQPVLPPPHRIFGGILRFLRQQKSYSLYAIAQRAGIDAGQLSRIENGHIPPPADETITQLVNALGLSITDPIRTLTLDTLRQAAAAYHKPRITKKKIAAMVHDIEAGFSAKIEFIPEVQLIRAGTVFAGISSGKWITGPIEMGIKDPKTGTLVPVECIIRPPSETT
jgi:transcriptional regulator with XRE-family HTH domain